MRLRILMSLLAVGLWVGSLHADSVDIIVIVDESGSMAGEHAWLPGMINSLDVSLTGLGFTTNFGLYGFGNGVGGNFGLPGNLGREWLDGGNAAAFGVAAGNLTTTGGFEDGFSGLNYAFNNFTFTAGAAVNYILVTDEDRDNGNAALTFASTLAALNGQSALLNVIVDNPFTCSGTALGVDSPLTAYKADGSGGFTTCSPGVVGNGFGTTETDYVALGLATGGAAWDLNQLRAGGMTAVSFTNAFVDIKVAEIIVQPVPEPSLLLLLGTALTGLAGFRKLRKPARRS